jgi:predicted nicotinamide N-methyase
VSERGAVATIEASLRRRFRVVETAVAVGDESLSLLHPASAEDLISEIDFDRDERLPYWAELWPSARVLAAVVLKMQGQGRTLLELGCGSGLVTSCASLRGFDVVATDYYEDAWRFARVNATRNGGGPVHGLMVDWRAMPSDLGRFDVVLASDVLYERQYGDLVAAAIDATMADDGAAFVADPGRVGRDAFLAALSTRGIEVRQRRDHPFADGEIRQKIAVFELARR